MRIQLSKILLPFFAFTLYSFKISLISGVGNGIRLDDFLILMVGIFILPKFIKNHRILLSSPTVIFFLLMISIGITSCLINYVLGSEVNIFVGLLFALRPLEYFIFFPVGYYLKNCKREIKILFLTYSIFIVILSILQRAGIAGGVTLFTTTSRASANLGGPWELAIISSFLIFWFIEYENKNKIMAFITLFPLILSESRITLIATVGVLLIHFLLPNIRTMKRYTYVSLLKLISLLTVIVSLVLIFFYLREGDIPFLSRISSSLNIETYTNLIGSFTENLSQGFEIKSQSNYMHYAYGDILDNLEEQSGGGDSSAFIRFHRWALLFNAFIHGNFLNFLFGLSPSYAGLAVDGNYVRTFIESGVIGFSILILWLVSFIKFSLKTSLVLTYSLVSLAISALFIDVFVAYKPMMLIWFFYGYFCFEESNL